MAAAKRAASLSPEPGNDNKRLRRSKREPAGRKSLPDGYLATETALKDQVGDGSDYDNDSDDSVTAGRWTRKKKRIKVPSPEPEPLPDDDEDDCATNSTTLAEAETTKSAPTASSRPQALPEDISLTFNVPDGHSGPFIVKLNLSDLQAAKPNITENAHRNHTSPQSIRPPATTALSRSINAKTGFLDLAPELRNAIYRQVLISDQGLRFPTGSPYVKNPIFTTALLATCRQIELEASQILYGDHSFQLGRDHRERGTFFEREWKEIGFHDARVFLQRIGPRNISNIRTLTLVLADGREDKADYSHKHRAANDNDLMTIMKMLAKHGRLQSLHIRLCVRKSITRDDARFLVNLQAVHADEVKITGVAAYGGRYHYPYEGYDYNGTLLRLSPQIKSDCIKQMKRATKLYPDYSAKVKE